MLKIEIENMQIIKAGMSNMRMSNMRLLDTSALNIHPYMADPWSKGKPASNCKYPPILYLPTRTRARPVLASNVG